MNYRTKAFALLAVCAFLFAACGGGGALKSSGSATTTFSLVDGTVGVALDAAVTTVFSAAITEPADWSSSFTLKKDDAGDSLCTEVTYDSATLTATCEHADFDRASSYTVSVSGLKDAGGLEIATASATFQTTPSVTLLRLDGTALSLTDRPIPRSATIKYTLASALTEEADRTAFEATITVTDADAVEVAGSYAWAANYLSVVFTPSSKLAYQTVYTIAMDTADEQTFTTMTHRDMNGDGYADAAVGAAGVSGGDANGAAYVFLGSANGIADCDPVAEACTDTTITGTAAGDRLGRSFSVGDVNGDGYEDLIVGAGYAPGNNRNGAVYVHLGSSSGISATAATTIEGEVIQNYLGYSVSAGDVNGDGYDDLIAGALGAKDQDNPNGKAYVFLGSADGIADCTVGDGACEDTTINGAANDDRLGRSISAGDVNGDGYDDLIVGAYGVPAGTYSGSAYVFLGSADGIADCDLSGTGSADTTITGSASSYLGYSVSTAGDVNGDGYDDIIVGAYTPADTGSAYLFLGSATGIADCTIGGTCAAFKATLTGAATQDRFGVSVSTAGDVNGDGYDDIIVGANGVDDVHGNPNYGAAYVFLGSASGISGTADTTIMGETSGDLLGYSVSTAGDVDGDGYDDIFAGANGYAGGNANGAAYLFLGSASGVSDTATTTITGADADDVLGSVR